MKAPSHTQPSPVTQHEHALSNVVDIMARLRGPEGCPWDREQTPESLKPYLLEEVYEVLEAIDAKDPVHLQEELGDLLLQILFHSQIASEEGHFSYQDVEKTLCEKLIRRHPHVFQKQGQHSPTTSGEVLRQWEELKQEEKGPNQTATSVLAAIPKVSPALQRALQVQKRASRVGFDWSTIEPVLEKFKEELDELYTATTIASQPFDHSTTSPKANPVDPHVEAELGDVLFSLVNVSRFLRVNPEEALRKSTNKFVSRFQYVESQATGQGKQVKDFLPEQLDLWWESAKQHEDDASQLPDSTKDLPHE